MCGYGTRVRNKNVLSCLVIVCVLIASAPDCYPRLDIRPYRHLEISVASLA